MDGLQDAVLPRPPVIDPDLAAAGSEGVQVHDPFFIHLGVADGLVGELQRQIRCVLGHGIVEDQAGEGGGSVGGVVAHGEIDGVAQDGEVGGVLVFGDQYLMLDPGEVHPVDGPVHARLGRGAGPGRGRGRRDGRRRGKAQAA